MFSIFKRKPDLLQEFHRICLDSKHTNITEKKHPTHVPAYLVPSKLKLGTGSDLEIYHDSNHSYIDNTGTGHLYIKDTGIVKVRTASFGVDNAVIELDSQEVPILDGSAKEFIKILTILFLFIPIIFLCCRLFCFFLFYNRFIM